MDSPRLLVFDETANPHAIATSLESRGYRIIPIGPFDEVPQVLRREQPALLIVAHGANTGHESDGRLDGFRSLARELRIPILDVVEAGDDLKERVGSSAKGDDWVLHGCPPEELDARIERLILRPTPAPIEAPFSAMVVHDMRTPLNVIGLSLRMIEQVLPRDDPEVEEDLRFIDENLRQIERMLSQLSDYARLFERGQPLSVSPFDPRRMVDELLEDRADRPGRKGAPVTLDVQESCPAEATLDQARARMAIDYALINANAAAADGPIRLTLRGKPERLLVEVAVDRPPPSSVSSVALSPQAFERLCGCSADRRGMDLAIAAQVSELFGGTAWLEAVEGRGTTIVLDWPTRIAGVS